MLITCCIVSIELSVCDVMKLQKSATATVEFTPDHALVIEDVATDVDVAFNWSMLSVEITREDHSVELLRHIIKLWVTIRGFSLAKMGIKQYKESPSTSTKKSVSLRKSLKRKAIPEE